MRVDQRLRMAMDAIKSPASSQGKSAKNPGLKLFAQTRTPLSLPCRFVPRFEGFRSELFGSPGRSGISARLARVLD